MLAHEHECAFTTGPPYLVFSLDRPCVDRLMCALLTVRCAAQKGKFLQRIDQQYPVHVSMPCPDADDSTSNLLEGLAVEHCWHSSWRQQSHLALQSQMHLSGAETADSNSARLGELGAGVALPVDVADRGVDDARHAARQLQRERGTVMLPSWLISRANI